MTVIDALKKTIAVLLQYKIIDYRLWIGETGFVKHGMAFLLPYLISVMYLVLRSTSRPTA